jgi:hypothetical protein
MQYVGLRLVTLIIVVKNNISMKEVSKWVSVSSTHKIFCRQVRDLGSNSAYTKNQLVSWPGGKSNNHRADVIDSNAIVTIKIKIKVSENRIFGY